MRSDWTCVAAGDAGKAGDGLVAPVSINTHEDVYSARVHLNLARLLHAWETEPVLLMKLQTMHAEYIRT